MSKNGGIIGISDHGGWAVLVTVAPNGGVPRFFPRPFVEALGIIA